MHPVFHVSLLKPWRESRWSCPVEEQELDVNVEPEPMYEIDRILKWCKVKVGRKKTREFLVIWQDLPLDEAEWVPEANFEDPAILRERIQEDKPSEDKTLVNQ